MITYPKIQGVFKRHMDGPDKGKFIMGAYTCPEFAYLEDNLWHFTEKVDGTNIRVMWDGSQVTFGGRTDRAILPEQLLQRLQERFLPQANKFGEVFGSTPAVLFGEGYGPKIQKVGYKYREDQDFVLFDVYIDGWWLKYADMTDISEQFGIDKVPIMSTGTLLEGMEHAKRGIKSAWGDFEAEGYVAKPLLDLQTRSGQRIVTKLKCCDFK